MNITKHGRSFTVVPGRNRAFWESVSNGTWEPETFAIFEHFIDSGHSYIDIGAWIGPTLLYGGSLARCAYGIEPDPIAYAELAENLAENKRLAQRVKLFNCCIAPTVGSLPFGSRSAGGDSMSSLLFAKGTTQWTVEGLTFDEFIRRSGASDCSFIKMDIEGGEYAALPSMVPYLRRSRPTLYLSLHPFYLGKPDAPGLLSKLKRNLVRFAKTLRILYSLRSYQYFYDGHANRISALRLLWRGTRGSGGAVVFSHRPWSPSASGSARPATCSGVELQPHC